MGAWSHALQAHQPHQSLYPLTVDDVAQSLENDDTWRPSRSSKRTISWQRYHFFRLLVISHDDQSRTLDDSISH
ncbi:hypothetical protein CCP4SC76_7930001 [Gammaproteobacteria bacterium]